MNLEQAISLAEQGQFHPQVLETLLNVSRKYLIQEKLNATILKEASYRDPGMGLLPYDSSESV